MNPLFDFLAGALRGVLRLALFAFVSLMVAGFLCLALLAALLALLWALLTGRRPTAWTTFMRMRQASEQFRRGVWQAQPSAGSRPGQTPADGPDIVDVQAREVPKQPPEQLPRQ